MIEYQIKLYNFRLKGPLICRTYSSPIRVKILSLLNAFTKNWKPARDREPWVNWQDIPPTEWLDEVYDGIQAADTFLFIISPDSVVSEICTLEIEHAIQHNKRLVPVVLRDVADEQVHSAMSAHNWVFLKEEDNFDANFELLIDALDTDLEYVREHTRLLTLAIDWDENQRRRSASLRGQELQTAEGCIECHCCLCTRARFSGLLLTYNVKKQ